MSLENSITLKGETLGCDSTSERAHELDDTTVSYLDTENAIISRRQALEFSRLADTFNLPSCLFSLARAIQWRYHRYWSIEDINTIITLYREAHAIFSGRHSARENLSDSLAGGPVLIEADFDSLEGPPTCALHICSIKLSQALNDRYQHTGRTEDIKEQIQLCESVLASLANSHYLWPEAATIMGIALRNRYQLLGSIRDLEDAVSLHQSVLDVRLVHHPDRHIALCELAISLYYHFITLGKIDDLHCAIALQEEVLSLRELGDFDPGASLEWLGMCIMRRSNHGGADNDLEKAVRLLHEALEFRTPGHRDRIGTLNSLGATLITCYHGTGDLAHLEYAAKLLSEGLTGLDEAHPQRHRALILLGMVYIHQYQQFGDHRGLDKGIRLFRESIPLCLPGHFSCVSALNSTGAAIKLRYELHGELDDLDQSIGLLRRGLSECQPGNFVRDSILNNLTHVLLMRFSLFGEEDDVREAITLIQEAVQHRPGDATLMLTLTESLRQSYKQSRRMEDLNEAVNVHDAWLERRDTGFLTASLHWHDLADLLLLRHQVTESVDDLDRAAESCQRALELRQPDHPERYQTLRIYSEVLRRRFISSGSLSEAKEALKLAEESVRLLPAAHSERAICLFNVSRLYLTRDIPYYSQSTAIRIFQLAMEDSDCNPQLRLRHGAEILEMAETAQGSNLDELSRALLLNSYRMTIDLLPRVAYFGLDARTRLRVLTKAEGLAINGAALALTLSQPDVAVEILEEGRAVFWNQHLRLRSQFDALPEHLSCPLAEISKRLDVEATNQSAIYDGDTAQDKSTIERQISQLRRLGERFNNLILEARSIPGYERFLQHEPFAVLARASEKAPAVILVAGRLSCFAVIIASPNLPAKALPLPDISVERVASLGKVLQISIKQSRQIPRDASKLQDRAMKVTGRAITTRGTNEILAELWVSIMQPIIQALSLKVGYNPTVTHLTGYLHCSCVSSIESSWQGTPEAHNLPNRRFYACTNPCGRRLQATA